MVDHGSETFTSLLEEIPQVLAFLNDNRMLAFLSKLTTPDERFSSDMLPAPG